MKKLSVWIAAATSLALLSISANANGGVAPVPEMDAGSAALAIGLVAGIVALIRERR